MNKKRVYIQEREMFRKISGLVLLIIGLLGVLLSIGGIIYSGRAVDAVVQALDDTLGLTGDSLATVEDTLTLARGTISDVNASLETVETTANTLAKTLEDTRPLLAEVAQIVGEDAPGSIESVQQAVPDMAEVAGVIDDTLLTLNNFKVEEEILGFALNFDLGVNYQPTVPFDETVSQLGSSFDGLPERLRDLEPSLTAANQNLGAVSENIYAVSDDLVTINGRVAEVDPLLGDYISIVQNINSTLSQTQNTVKAQAGNAKLALQVVMAWMGFLQFSLLYLGWDLFTRKDDDDDEELDEEEKDLDEKAESDEPL
jgi:methyl-accepting chemotaxis protein